MSHLLTVVQLIEKLCDTYYHRRFSVTIASTSFSFPHAKNKHKPVVFVSRLQATRWFVFPRKDVFLMSPPTKAHPCLYLQLQVSVFQHLQWDKEGPFIIPPCRHVLDVIDYLAPLEDYMIIE